MSEQMKKIRFEYAGNALGWCGLFSAPNGTQPGLYVPAEVAQGLLEALELADKMLTRLGPDPYSTGDEDTKDGWLKIRAAIATAKGEE